MLPPDHQRVRQETTSPEWLIPDSGTPESSTCVPNPKDLVENALRDQVCARVVTLAAAQRAIAADWMTAMQRLGLRAPGLSARILAGAPAAARRTMSAIA
jgi:hypothetical protein